MFRLLIFTVLLNIANCGNRVPNCRSKSLRKERNPEETFHKLAHQAIWTEQKFANSYKHNICFNIREVYKTDRYVLKYPMKDFKAKDIVVKVLHKTIFVSADCKEPKKSFRDVKMLPDNLSPEEASWCLLDGELDISFPYKTPLLTETRKTCGNINYSVITVPMADPVVTEQPCDLTVTPVF